MLRKESRSILLVAIMVFSLVAMSAAAIPVAASSSDTVTTSSDSGDSQTWTESDSGGYVAEGTSENSSVEVIFGPESYTGISSGTGQGEYGVPQRVGGRVVDENGDGLEDAEVTLQPTSLSSGNIWSVTETTNENGYWSVDDINNDDYMMVVEHGDYETFSTTVNISDGYLNNYVEMTPSGGTVHEENPDAAYVASDVTIHQFNPDANEGSIIQLSAQPESGANASMLVEVLEPLDETNISHLNVYQDGKQQMQIQPDRDPEVGGFAIKSDGIDSYTTINVEAVPKETERTFDIEAVDQSSGDPISGAEVDVIENDGNIKTYTTDSSGVATVTTTTVTPSVIIDHDDYMVDSATVDARLASSGGYTFQLQSLSGLSKDSISVSGQVLGDTGDSWEPIQNAQIEVTETSSDGFGYGVSDSNGNFDFTSYVGDGNEVAVTVSASGYETRTFYRTATTSGVDLGEVHLEVSEGEMEYVSDGEGTIYSEPLNGGNRTPLSGATVEIRDGQSEFDTVTTDSNGDFTFSGYAKSGTLTFYVDADDHYGQVVQADVGPAMDIGDVNLVDYSSPPKTPVEIGGNVSSSPVGQSDNADLSEFNVTVYNSTYGEIGNVSVTNGPSWTFTGETVGSEVILEFEADGHGTETVRTHVGDTNVDVTLDQYTSRERQTDFTASGSVVDETGTALGSGIGVDVYEADGTFMETVTTDSNGVYTVDNSTYSDKLVFETSPSGYSTASESAPVSSSMSVGDLTVTNFDGSTNPNATSTLNVDGYVFDENGDPVSNTNVDILGSDGTAIGSTTTNSSGYYSDTYSSVSSSFVVAQAYNGHSTNTSDPVTLADTTTEKSVSMDVTVHNLDDSVNRNPGQTDVTLSGQVTDNSTSSGIEEAEVVVYEQDGNQVASTTTDNNGDYTVNVSTYGDSLYTEVGADGYFNSSDVFGVASSVTKNFALDPQEGRLDDTVSYNVAGTAVVCPASNPDCTDPARVSNANVTITDVDDQVIAEFTTGSSGSFSYNGETDSSAVQVTVEKGDYQPAIGVADVASGGKNFKEMVLLADSGMPTENPQSFTLNGTVEGATAFSGDSEVLQGATVEVVDAYGNNLGTTTTASDGTFSFSNSTDAPSLWVKYSHENYSNEERVYFMEDDRDIDAGTVTLESLYDSGEVDTFGLTGQVVSSPPATPDSDTLVAVEGAFVRVHEGDEIIALGRTDASGEFDLQGLSSRAGVVQVSIERSGYATKTETVAPSDGETMKMGEVELDNIEGTENASDVTLNGMLIEENPFSTENDTAIEDATVELFANGQKIDSYYVRNGYFEVSGAVYGSGVEMRVTSDNHTDIRRTYDVGDHENLEVRMVPDSFDTGEGGEVNFGDIFDDWNRVEICDTTIDPSPSEDGEQYLNFGSDEVRILEDEVVVVDHETGGEDHYAYPAAGTIDLEYEDATLTIGDGTVEVDGCGYVAFDPSDPSFDLPGGATVGFESDTIYVGVPTKVNVVGLVDEYLAGTVGKEAVPKFRVSPTTGRTTVEVTEYVRQNANRFGATVIEFTVDNDDGKVKMELGNLDAGREYQVFQDGEEWQTVEADEDGTIEFQKTSGWSEHEFTVVAQSADDGPAGGGTDEGRVPVIGDAPSSPILIALLAVLLLAAAGGYYWYRRREEENVEVEGPNAAD